MTRWPCAQLSRFRPWISAIPIGPSDDFENFEASVAGDVGVARRVQEETDPRGPGSRTLSQGPFRVTARRFRLAFVSPDLSRSLLTRPDIPTPLDPAMLDSSFDPPPPSPAGRTPGLPPATVQSDHGTTSRVEGRVESRAESRMDGRTEGRIEVRTEDRLDDDMAQGRDQADEVDPRRASSTGAVDLELAGPAVYAELRRIAGRYVHGEPANRTLDATALVHEVWLSLERHPMPPRRDPAHFLASCARLMRQILVTHARRRRIRGRVHQAHAELLDRAVMALERSDDSLERVGASLERLDEVDPRKASIVELRSFAGVPEVRIAELLDISPRTVRREWTLARAWLRHDMETHP